MIKYFQSIVHLEQDRPPYHYKIIILIIIIIIMLTIGLKYRAQIGKCSSYFYPEDWGGFLPRNAVIFHFNVFNKALEVNDKKFTSTYIRIYNLIPF
jgi:hypothetical protein